MDQTKTPLADALENMCKDAYIPFDVPGHKGTLPEMLEYFGDRCVQLDKNSREAIDYLCQSQGVIREAEDLTAEAFGASHAFFMVGGTTSSVQAMIMSACTPGDKIILPRNVHFSVITAVILAGAVPVYVDPVVHPRLGIALGMRVEDVEQCIRQNTDAKAIVVNNPTYYGICSDIQRIVQLAHAYQMLVLADEAHGTHFYFSDLLPLGAMQCGADMSAISMHKTGGSLTQSSVLLVADTVSAEHVNSVINLTRTSSASYLLMASLDIARHILATRGKTLMDNLVGMACTAREQINQIKGCYAFGKEIIDGNAVADFDVTKLSVHTADMGFAGIEVYTLLADRYRVQVEFGDMRNILALCTLGDSKENLTLLVNALRNVSELQQHTILSCPPCEYITPIIKLSPRKAFYAKKQKIPIAQCAGKICGDAVMIYPPGIPLLAPGELVTEQIVEHILYAKEKGCTVSGISANGTIHVVDI